MAALDDLIAELERSYTETRDRLSDPAVYNDHHEAADVGRRLKQLEGPYNLAQEWRQGRAPPQAARGGARPRGEGAEHETQGARPGKGPKAAVAGGRPRG